ncbi:acyltransferase family protein [Epibacterium sp. Ofav1-8]|uniref:acyltransferase family protein n=1 Tax=Epibacterium sp. Ofav1-8 TaxID=2917735 RepID=UPI001EF446AC|nr:acyltransferase [Epibacterium sp. Ofav1-8]MCG7623978.1 acyltransferase [Epibacterium sp. Ofav1-8]
MQALTASQAHRAYLERTRFGALDGLRALAILAVLIHHSALAQGSGPWSRGFLGVDLFFVISGFLITTLLLRERDRDGTISLRGFFWRRALRILPLYYLVVTLAGSYFLFWRGHAETLQLWPAYYLFFANFLTDHIPTLYPTWSLSMEEQFYLIWPLAMICLPQRLWGWALGLGVLVNVVAVTGALEIFGIRAFSWGPLHVHLPDATYAPLLMGAGLALMLHQPRGFAMLWRLFCAPAAALLCLLMLLLLLFGLLPQVLAGWPYFLVHLAMTTWLATLVLHEEGWLHPLLRLRPLARIGTVSYGIYLLHLMVLHVVTIMAGRLNLAQDSIAFILLYWGGTLALAEVSFRYYESHFFRLRNKPFGRVAARGRSRP